MLFLKKLHGASQQTDELQNMERGKLETEETVKCKGLKTRKISMCLQNRSSKVGAIENVT